MSRDSSVSSVGEPPRQPPRASGEAGAATESTHVYAGNRDSGMPVGEACSVTVDDEPLDCRYDLFSASPSGFEWGYGGSGPAQLAIAILAHAYDEDLIDGEERTYLSLEPEIAPQDAAVFPLVTNDDRLVDLADRVAADLRAAGLAVAYDDSGSIGRRYRRQDEVGTPFCVTVDRDGIEGDGPDTVTVRERDSAAQVRVPADELAGELAALRAGDSFDALLERYETVETDVETN